MSNPKVFEFAKEIGMTPLALMDKIKQWQIPIKNHMAEIEPDQMVLIKQNLTGKPNQKAGDEDAKKSPAKKTAARKTAAVKPPPRAENAKSAMTAKAVTSTVTKTPAAAPMDTSSSKGVIRRKTSDLDQKAKIISKPESDAAETLGTNVAEEVVVAPTRKVQETAPIVTQRTAPTEAPVTRVAPPVIQTVAQAPAPQVSSPAAQPQQSVQQVTTSVAAAPTTSGVPIPSRKKEVAIGDSGISSSAQPDEI